MPDAAAERSVQDLLTGSKTCRSLRRAARAGSRVISYGQQHIPLVMLKVTVSSKKNAGAVDFRYKLLESPTPKNEKLKEFTHRISDLPHNSKLTACVAMEASVHVEQTRSRCEPVAVSGGRRGAGCGGGEVRPGHGEGIVDVQVAEEVCGTRDELGGGHTVKNKRAEHDGATAK